MPFILDVDHSPTILSPSHGLAVNHDIAFRPDDGEWEHILSHTDMSF